MSLTSIDPEQEWRTCTECGMEKRLVNFHKSPKGAMGRQSKCRKCVSAKNKERSPSLVDSRRKGRLKRYNLTQDDFDRMLADQDHKCAICGTTDPAGRHNQWHIDHDHSCCDGAFSCGKCLRGILCSQCNRGIGWFKDDADLMASAMAYLLRSNSCELVEGVANG